MRFSRRRNSFRPDLRTLTRKEIAQKTVVTEGTKGKPVRPESYIPRNLASVYLRDANKMIDYHACFMDSGGTSPSFGRGCDNKDGDPLFDEFIIDAFLTPNHTD